MSINNMGKMIKIEGSWFEITGYRMEKGVVEYFVSDKNKWVFDAEVMDMKDKWDHTEKT